MGIGALPLWGKIREIPAIKQTLRGVNAGAAGLMTAAFVDLWLKLVHDGSEASLVIMFLGVQVVLKQSPAKVVISALFIGIGIALAGWTV
jgi:chromate transport protein ChrA